MKKTLSLLIPALLLVPAVASAQANTGKVSGRVLAEGNGLPGVLVTATSPALQGERSTVTQGNGDYVLAQLPAGDYSLSYELEGFQPVRQEVKVSVDQSVPLNQTMNLSDVMEEIVVTSETATISRDIPSQTTYEKETIEQLAITRTIEDTVVLAPGVHATGPQSDGSINGQAISISGSQSYENLFMVNGVVVNENTRGQAREFIIEDAVQETTVSASGVSAEYGRFNGGVVNVITKSGGNQFSGSLRANISKEAWQGKNELSPDELDSTQNETYEATFGGRIVRDKLWFFVAARDLERTQTDTLQQTLIPLSQDIARDRLEGKLTLSPTAEHRIVSAYQERNAATANDHFSAIDRSTLNPQRQDLEDLWSVNYTGVLTPNFFIEAQYSERGYLLGQGVGGTTTDFVDGSWIVDLTSFSFLNSPVFCAVCIDTQRDNENSLIKASYFLATESRGSHDLVFGYDSFTDINVIENHQSASDFHVWAFEPFIVRGENVFPQFTANGSNRLRWTPVLESTRGMQFETDSIFVNDVWRLGDKTSINLGLRYDMNNSSNGSNEVISDDDKLAPRMGFAYDFKADGDLVLNASYAQYAATINTGANIGGTTGSAGALGNWTWQYNGPDINADPNAANLLNAQQAMQIIQAWFNSIGGVENTSQRIELTIPGLGLQVPESLVTPSSEELSVGLVKRLGSKGLVRADIVHREFDDFYAEQTDTVTGTVQNPDGTSSDLTWFVNDNSISERVYDGLHTQFSYRFTDRFTLAGNWTWSHARGNFDGETEGNAALPQGAASYPELKAFENHHSRGDLMIDQRHKVAVWAIYDIIESNRNRLSVSLLQRYGTGRPFIGSSLSGPGSVDSRPYVDIASLGYLESPTDVNYWFYSRDSERTEDISSTDIAFNYAFVVNPNGRNQFEVFIQPEVINVFNEDAVQFVDATIEDATNNSSYVTFNPFTDTPVEGVHYGKGANFGTPTSANDFQAPREFRFSIGFRF